MQTYTIKKKEININNPNTFLVEDEIAPEHVQFVINDASEIQNIEELEFFLQYKNKLGERGVEVLTSTYANKELKLDWYPSKEFTKENGKTEIQIFGLVGAYEHTPDETFQADAIYYILDDEQYIKITPTTGASVSAYETEHGTLVYEYFVNTRWSTIKTSVNLPENIKGTDFDYYDSDRFEQIVQEVLNAEANTKTYKEQAESAKDDAEDARDKAEDWAEKDTEVESGKYSAKHWANESELSASDSEDSAEDSEAWAVGKRNGTDVGSSDPAYHNNSKYYKGLAESANTSAQTAKTGAETARDKAQDWAEKETAVETGKYSAKYWAERAHEELDGKANKSEMAVSTSGDKTTIQLKTGTSAVVLNSHQDISGKANKSEMSVSTSGDKTTITLKSGTSAQVLNSHQSISGKADKESSSANGYLAKFNSSGNPVNSSILAEDVSNVVSLNEGTPEDKSNTAVVSDSDGYVKIKSIKGRSRAWNQLCPKYNYTSTSNNITISGDGTGEITVTVSSGASSYNQITVGSVNIVVGHKYLLTTNFSTSARFSGSYYLGTHDASLSDRITTAILTGSNPLYLYVGGESTVGTYKLKPCLYDLTLIFGSGNEPTSVSDALAAIPSLGEYNAYDSGSLISNEISGVESVGRNLLEPSKLNSAGTWNDGVLTSTPNSLYSATGTAGWSGIDFLPNTQYYIRAKLKVGSSVTSLRLQVNYSDGTNSTSSGVSGGGTLYVYITSTSGKTVTNVMFNYSSGGSDEAYVSEFIIKKSDSYDGTYTPYHKDTISFPDTITLKSAGSIRDEYDPETGVITRRVGSVDLGSLTYVYNSENSVFYSDQVQLKGYDTFYANLTCQRYLYEGGVEWASHSDKTVGTRFGLTSDVYALIIKDTAYSDATTFKNVLSGVYLNYELATPYTETISPVTNILETEEGGTIRLIHEESPVIDDTYSIIYPNKIRARLDRAEGNINELQGSLARIEVSPSKNNYSVGELLVYDGTLYKVTTAIATNDALVVGSNIQAQTVSGEISDIITPINVYVSPNTGVTVYTGSYAKYNPACQLVNINMRVTLSQSDTAKHIAIGTIEETYRPSVTMVGWGTDNQNDIPACLVVTNDGTIHLYRDNNTSTNDIRFGFSYII